jgi:hypothetical protein
VPDLLQLLRTAPSVACALGLGFRLRLLLASRPAEAFPPATGDNVRNSLTHLASPLRPAEDFFPGDSSSGAACAHRGRKWGQASSSCINPSQHSPAAAVLSSSLEARLQQRASPRTPSTPTAGSSTRPPSTSSPARGTSAWGFVSDCVGTLRVAQLDQDSSVSLLRTSARVESL